jgi:hypothetical protein
MPTTRFDPARHGFRFPNNFPGRTVVAGVPVSTRGRAGGMVYAAADYFACRLEVPRDATSPADGTPLGDLIRRRHEQSLVDMAPAFVERALWPWDTDADRFAWGARADRQLASLMQSLERGHPVPIGLIAAIPGADGCHQVLAVGVERTGTGEGEVNLLVYDPEAPGELVTLAGDPASSSFVSSRDHGARPWRTWFIADAYAPQVPPVVLSLRTVVSGAGPALTRSATSLEMAQVGEDGSVRVASRRETGRWSTSVAAPARSGLPGSPVTLVARPTCELPGHAEPRNVALWRAMLDAPRVEALWAGRDGAVRIAGSDARLGAGNWSEPQVLTPPGALPPGGPVSAIASGAERFDVFWVGAAGAVMQATWRGPLDDGSWSTPARVTEPDEAPHGAVVAVLARMDDHLDLYWAGRDGQVRSTFRDGRMHEGRWNPVFAISEPGATVPGGAVTAIARTPIQLDVFWVGPQGEVVSNWWNARVNSARWNVPFDVSEPAAAPPGAPVAVVARKWEQLDIFWAGLDGAVETSWWNARVNAGRWNRAFRIAEPESTRPGELVAAVARGNDELEVFWSAREGGVWASRWHASEHGALWQRPVPVLTGPANAES